MDTSRVLLGIALLAWGVVVATGGWWIASDFNRARRIGEKRWRIDRGTARRRGLTRDEWLDRWATSQKALAKRLGMPALAAWFALSIWTILRGLSG